ncbi:MAG TPA: histidine kinase [Candidatus Methylacidiphilales bacterium]|nr:histidine kinase [Candidatus Methylacidiphilales bacterium]
MQLIPTLRSLLRGMALSFLAYGLLGMVLVAHSSLGSTLPAWDALRMVVRDWTPWAIVTPFAFQLVWHLPLEGGRRWKVAVVAHIAAALVILTLVTAWLEMDNGVWRFMQAQQRFGFQMQPGQSGGGQQRGGPDFRAIMMAQNPGSPLLQGQAPYVWIARIPGIIYQSQFMTRPRPPKPFMPFPPGTHPLVIAIFLLGMRFPVYLAIVSVAHAFFFYERAQERERRSLGLEAGLVKSRLEALRMQLQPHFLFNSLNSIAELVHKDPDKADEMLVALSDLLRLTLEKTDQQEIPLQQELEFVDRYLAMQKVRLADRLIIKRDIAPETRQALIPVFLLQPVVENSLRHGLEPVPGGGILALKSEVSPVPGPGGAPELRITISDTGPGLHEQQPGEKQGRQGIGLANTRARLRELYGATASIQLRNNSEMEAGAKGLIVEIRLPFQLAEEEIRGTSTSTKSPSPAVADPLRGYGVSMLRREAAR